MSQSQVAPHRSPPEYTFEFDSSLTSWNIPEKEWITKHKKPWNGLATGCIVFNPEGKVLVIQRASHDSMPNKWEVPGGAADGPGETFLQGAARELWEEAGLVAKRFTHVVSEGPGREPGRVYTNRTGARTYCQFSFIVQVESCEQVRIDPNEHQAYLWVTEDEIKTQRTDDHALPMTNVKVLSTIVEAFRLRKEAAGVK